MSWITCIDVFHICTQMCNMMFSQLCVKWPPAEETPTCSKETSSGTPETVTRRDHEKSLDISTPERTATNDNMINNNLTNVNGDLTNSANYGQVSSMATMLLNGQAASSKSLVANMPTALLYWPLMQLASSANEDVALGVAVGSRGGGIVEGGACDVRAALLLLLIGKCSTYQAALEEVGGEEFFRYLKNTFQLGPELPCILNIFRVLAHAQESCNIVLNAVSQCPYDFV